jgi:hypothetical protein
VARPPLTPVRQGERAERGVSVRGKRELSRYRQAELVRRKGQHLSDGDVEPYPAAGQAEDGRITRVPFKVDPHKLLRTGGDPRRRSAHHRPAP